VALALFGWQLTRLASSRQAHRGFRRPAKKLKIFLRKPLQVQRRSV
jgi:hypothetical protein